MHLILPYPPSSNSLWVRTHRGMRRSDEYLSWIEQVQWESIQRKWPQIDGPFGCHITAHRPDKRKRDINNLIDAPLDALQHCGVIENDCLAQWVRAEWADAQTEVPIISVTLK